MAKQVMPEARLEPRPSDITLPEEEMLKISLFAQLKRKPSLDKFPGALILRRYQQGEVIFRQGDAGSTALYILTSADVQALLESLTPQLWRGDGRARMDEAEELNRRLEAQRANPKNDLLRQAATLYLSLARTTQPWAQSWFGRLFGRGQANDVQREKPKSIIINGTMAVDYKSRQTFLLEGELFGEMNCLYGGPRPMTVVASRNCYVLEMLRNIFDQLQKDPAYHARMDEIYKQRVLQLHLRRLSLFADLTDEQFENVRCEVELLTFERGQVIFDEFDRPDHLYIVRSGLVKVLKKASALFNPDSVRDWQGLCAALREGQTEPASPRGKLWQMLPESLRPLILRPENTALLTGAEQQQILYALNDAVKDARLSDNKEFQPVLQQTAFALRNKPLLDRKRNWRLQDARHFNRLLLEAILGRSLRSYQQRVGPECVIYYAARGDFIGEMGLLTGEARSATCVAQGHPQDEAKTKESTRVELVRITESTLRRLLKESAAVRDKIEARQAERKLLTEKLVHTPIYEDTLSFAERTENLGLVQGQKLLLIDLNRCTRCDECVRACVNTHADGHSRLFLDGPRFGKYLVPATCRSCLDPVCMIGCPVGSINRGEHAQMVIEDWCIGCGLCAKQCPYGAIQMHDIGIIAGDAPGWRYLPASAVKDANWQRPRFGDGRWASEGRGPFHYDHEFKARLRAHMASPRLPDNKAKEPLYFRYTFNLPSYLLTPDSQFKLEVQSTDPQVLVWVNGLEVLAADKPKGGKYEFWLPPRAASAPPAEKPPPPKAVPRQLWRGELAQVAAAAPPPKPARPTPILRAGSNVIAVQVTPALDPAEVFLEVRLDEINCPSVPSQVSEEVTEKQVAERAVVCDLCSNLAGRVPACVNACPHGAAQRIDARFELPVLLQLGTDLTDGKSTMIQESG